MTVQSEPGKPTNHNFFRDITTYSRRDNFIELYKANFNLFEGINCENVEGPIFNPVYDYSLFEIKSSSFNVIRNGYFDLVGYGYAIIQIVGEDVDIWSLSRGNVIEANNINHCPNYGLYIGDHTRKNIIRHNHFSNNGTQDVKIEPGGLALHNEIYDNYFANGEAGKISAHADTKTLQMWYSQENDHLELRPHVLVEELTILSNFYLNNKTIWSGTAADTGSKLLWGAGSPEGVVFGKVGSLYLRTDGGSSTTMYVKESGDGTQTGWVAK